MIKVSSHFTKALAVAEEQWYRQILQSLHVKARMMGKMEDVLEGKDSELPGKTIIFQLFKNQLLILTNIIGELDMALC